jgi:LytS/YehU family sensor histidine kinase
LLAIERNNQEALEKITLENKATQSKLTAIKSQMNPHFFFNALNTVQSFILSNEKKEAIGFLNKFSTLTRNILELTEKEFISIDNEIKTLSLYLDIEKERFDHDFGYEINVENNIDTENIKIPSMLLQPFVENAVKHGLLHKQGTKVLIISFGQKDNFIHIHIEDNGIGRKKSHEINQQRNKTHQSFATNAIDERIALLNNNKKEKITLEYIDKDLDHEETTGTIVQLKIPIL